MTFEKEVTVEVDEGDMDEVRETLDEIKDHARSAQRHITQLHIKKKKLENQTIGIEASVGEDDGDDINLREAIRVLRRESETKFPHEDYEYREGYHGALRDLEYALDGHLDIEKIRERLDGEQ